MLKRKHQPVASAYVGVAVALQQRRGVLDVEVLKLRQEADGPQQTEAECPMGGVDQQQSWAMQHTPHTAIQGQSARPPAARRAASDP